MPENSSSKHCLLLSAVAERFLRYAQIELCFAEQSIVKYRDCLTHVRRIVGDRPIEAYVRDDLLNLKAALLQRGNGVSRQVSILSAFKSLLTYCQEQEGLAVLDPWSVVIPKRPRREVTFLTVAEVSRFVSAISVECCNGRPSPTGLRFRAIVEALLGSAMRIGELLALDRDQIDFVNQEARIIGKGNKQRTVFFTDRAISWLKKYLDIRTDDGPALFICHQGGRLHRTDIWRPFLHYRRLAGINKRVTPHLLRHTAATQLLFNGCPIGHIKEILGHERLETTCRYYLGLDHRAAKQAHSVFLRYDAEKS